MPFYEIDGVVPVCDPTSYVHPSADVIGDVIIGPGCYIGPSASLRGDFGRIRIEAGSNVQDSCTVHVYPGADVVLAEGSHVGHGAILHGCTLEPRVLVGMNSVVMDGAVIGADSLIGAGSVVPAGFVAPARSLVIGSPARVVRELDADQLAWKANAPGVYQALAQRSLATIREVTPLAAEQPDRARVSTDSSVSRPLHELRAERERDGGA
ncbi:phenylacetic acid degradation protein PaaY [Pimelobacter simplex]|uniref:Carbonic anhydrase, family 3 n=1 Tax=Nocardioides simplex TaxID=2045 RepID=A0A0A1DP88_NOCSI|nr:transferase hexapeptide repeat family protein [Pimelobacter simplex]AIY19231.1 carbonic anhydrase, family 3 [Pimelobacter simplex]MCG8149302.1 phenylacetic acid degradation protein PaaY [Pimelobacter simplex]GEB16567.1 phenylacetic acid degradation protein PaaY [Pimelobacter simplex]SFM20787.1 phenylacetic acid degradation protein [Pimelobacter simplex]